MSTPNASCGFSDYAYVKSYVDPNGKIQAGWKTSLCSREESIRVYDRLCPLKMTLNITSNSA